ncbi:MAG: ABC transporter permease [Planctomycetota bacterium]
MTDATSKPPSAPLAFVSSMGEKTTSTIDHIGMMWYLLADALGWVIMRATTRKARLGRVAIVSQLVRVGVQSIFIVSLVSGAIGLILSLQMAGPLDQLGQRGLIPSIVGVAVFRELGPLIAAVVMVGFAGAAIAAEIGTMVVNEEIEALEAHALNPVRFLVVPRIIATVISMGCLGVIADIVAVGASALLCKVVFRIGYVTFWNNVDAYVDGADVLTGLFKAFIFGGLIGLIACGNGLKVTGGAAGVGRATTNTVVESIVAIIICSLIFTVIFYSLGII